MNRLHMVEKELIKTNIAKFQIGDTVRVFVKVKEGEKERIQAFEGYVIARKGAMQRETFTVRKLSHGVGVERIFPVHSPSIDKIVVLKSGEVRRAKLYYLKGKKGKATKLAEKNMS